MQWNELLKFNVILFDDFTTLDAFGPAEIIRCVPNVYSLSYHSINGGFVTNSLQAPINTLPFSEIDQSGILLIPGGMGTRELVNDNDFIKRLKGLAEKAPYVLTVCTGSALLAKTGLLNGVNATTNKKAFEWVCSNGKEVNWIKKARWVKDGKYYTSSGVTAGIDMTLGFVSDLHGMETAQAIAKHIEHIWNCDADNDPFAVL
jgi:transcriptional regulator GlxA family with amidase domain